MKQHNEVAVISSGQLTVRANGLRLSIVTGIIQKHRQMERIPEGI